MAKRIPKKLSVGIKQYRVESVGRLERDVWGMIMHRMHKIFIARYAHRKLTKQEQWETFWHEAVHAILHDMKRHDLNNERFVNAFCRRLYQALESK